jgi:16S rRNA (uracil1498-N3)-methyltransferase
MNLFHTTQIQGKIAIFEQEETRHLTVLRKQIGDYLNFTDGKGSFFEGKITAIDKRNCFVEISKVIEQYQPLPYSLHLGIAPTKNIDRLEWLLEKATEIGISEITPLLCQNSERDKIRLDRLEGILLSAMKQSLQCYLPKLNPLTKFADFIKNTALITDTQRFIAYCNQEHLAHFTTLRLQPSVPIVITIGPEGDFSEKEIKLALNAGFQGISLGKNRLRTETAGLFVTSWVAATLH